MRKNEHIDRNRGGNDNPQKGKSLLIAKSVRSHEDKCFKLASCSPVAFVLMFSVNRMEMTTMFGFPLNFGKEARSFITIAIENFP